MGHGVMEEREQGTDDMVLDFQFSQADDDDVLDVDDGDNKDELVKDIYDAPVVDKLAKDVSDADTAVDELPEKDVDNAVDELLKKDVDDAVDELAKKDVDNTDTAIDEPVLKRAKGQAGDWVRPSKRPCLRCGLVHRDYMVTSWMDGLNEFDCKIYIPDVNDLKMDGDTILLPDHVLKVLDDLYQRKRQAIDKDDSDDVPFVADSLTDETEVPDSQDQIEP